jgi:hypothetical protein
MNRLAAARRFRLLLVGVFPLALVGCPGGTDPDERAPDWTYAGTWTLSLSEGVFRDPSGDLDLPIHSCSADSIRLTLLDNEWRSIPPSALSRGGGYSSQVHGTHDGGSIVCTGLDGVSLPAPFLQDTVFSFPTGTLEGSVECSSGDCPPDRPSSVSLALIDIMPEAPAGIAFHIELPARARFPDVFLPQWTGQFVLWKAVSSPSGVARTELLAGTWSATR